MKIQESTFEQFRQITEDGLVLLGCGGDLMEWVDGVTQMLKEEKIAQLDFEVTQALKVETTGGRVDLLLLFDWNKVNVGHLAMWRIGFGDCSWLSDYVVNYADHFGYETENKSHLTEDYWSWSGENDGWDDNEYPDEDEEWENYDREYYDDDDGEVVF